MFTVLSCKKKEKEATDSSPSSTVSQKINGYLSSIKQYSIINNSLTLENGFTYAILFDSLRDKNIVNSYYGIDVGTISVNNVTLKKETLINAPNSFSYADSSNSIVNKPQSWSISGGASFPSLSFSDDSSYPSYLGYNNLPDTLIGGISNTILINSYYGVDRIDVLFRNGPNSLSKSINPPTKYLILNSSDIGQLMAGGHQQLNFRINFF